MFVHGPRIAQGFREALLGRALGPHGGVPMGLRDAQSASEHHAHVVLGTGIAGFRQGGAGIRQAVASSPFRSAAVPVS